MHDHGSIPAKRSLIASSADTNAGMPCIPEFDLLIAEVAPANGGD